MAPGAMQWNDTTDKALLLIMIARGGLSGSEWIGVSTDMQNKGYQVSASACKQHFHKLRKENGIAVGGGRSAGTPRATPSKKATATKAKKRKAADEDIENEDDEEEFGGDYATPSKKAKKEEYNEDEGFGSAAPSFKTEDLDEDGKVKSRQIIDLENDDIYDDEERDG